MDLREAKGTSEDVLEKRSQKMQKSSIKESSEKKIPDNDDIIKWCGVRALCDSHEMSYPYFFNLVILFARGTKKLGFCSCSACNRGYREMLALVENVTEKKKLTAQSREIVIKARGEKIDGFTIDFSEIIKSMDSKSSPNKTTENDHVISKPKREGKIVIELESEVIENAVFSVLKSEKGQEIIQSIPRKRSKQLKS